MNHTVMRVNDVRSDSMIGWWSVIPAHRNSRRQFVGRESGTIFAAVVMNDLIPTVHEDVS